jgi:Tfp pilus assembly protein PilN
MSILQPQDVSADLGAALSAGVRMPRVNLLPPEIIEGRKLRRTKAVLAGSLTLVVAALGVGYVTQVNAKNSAQDELSQAQSEGARLQAEQAKYADVPKTIAAIDAAETSREVAMSQDVEWYRTLTNFSLTLPQNVWFQTLNLQLAGSGDAAAVPAAGEAANGIGVLTVEGRAKDHPDVATWLDVLGRQPGMADAYFSQSTKSKAGSTPIVDFSSTATITDEALSHRYDRKQG